MGSMSNATPGPGRITRPQRALRWPNYPAAFMAIWLALAVLLALCWLWLPRSVSAFSFRMNMPFIAFLALAAMGQALVLMVRGIDLSAPAIVTAASMVMVGLSGGQDGQLWLGLLGGFGVALVIGAVNGVLIALLRLNALIVTLAVGSILSGIILWYSRTFAAVAKAPDLLQHAVALRVFGLPIPVWTALLVLVLMTIVLRRTRTGREFEAVGANPVSAHAAGVAVVWYQGGAYVAAAGLYAILAFLLSGFIGNPTTGIGDPYLLAPIAAAVLGGTAISGGIGSMVAVTGAAFFLIQLEQAAKMLGLATSWQMIVQGVAITIGMWLPQLGKALRRR